MRCGNFSLSKYREEPSGFCCDLCDSYENHATVELFIFKHSYNLCPKCYNEIRNEFITHELKIDENEEE